MDNPANEQIVDHGLFAAAQTGDHAALRTLWERHRRYLAVVILAHKPAESDVEDLLQEVAAAMVSKISTVREASALLPWLRMVALNASRLAGRKLNARPVQSLGGGIGERGTGDPLDARPSGASDTDPEQNTQTRHDSGWMMKLVGNLPDDYREPLLLRCVHDMSYRQIGDVMGLPETTVETRIARGRRMLKDLVLQAEKSRGSGLFPAENRAGVARSRIE